MRFTVRRMMVAVALVGLMLGACLAIKRLKERADEYWQRAWGYARKAEPYRRNIGLTQAEWEAKGEAAKRASENSWYKFGPGPAPDDCRKFLPHFASLRDKYRFAARYPFLPVVPDPPEPK